MSRQSRVDILLPINPQPLLFVWSQSHLSRCLDVSSSANHTHMQTAYTHTHTHRWIIHNCTHISPTLCSVNNLFPISTHQKGIEMTLSRARWNANDVLHDSLMRYVNDSISQIVQTVKKTQIHTQIHALQLLAFMQIMYLHFFTMQLHAVFLVKYTRYSLLLCNVVYL